MSGHTVDSSGRWTRISIEHETLASAHHVPDTSITSNLIRTDTQAIPRDGEPARRDRPIDRGAVNSPVHVAADDPLTRSLFARARLRNPGVRTPCTPCTEAQASRCPPKSLFPQALLYPLPLTL